MPKRTPPTAARQKVENPAVQRELDAIGRAFDRASRSPATARRFLQQAGIVDSQGNLAKRYR